MFTVKPVTISLGQNENISGVLSIPSSLSKEKQTGVIIAHGAGNDMENPLIVSMAEGLAEAGYITLRFNFPYREKGKKTPDSQKRLIYTWHKVYQFLQHDSGHVIRSFVAAGKSMGGRIASQMIADGTLPADRLIFLGYPLHPAGKKEKLRDSHLYTIPIPMLFFTGTRDNLCDMSMLQKVLNRLSASWQLVVIDGGDHSFHVLKSKGMTQSDVYRFIIENTIKWLENT